MDKVETLADVLLPEYNWVCKGTVISKKYSYLLSDEARVGSLGVSIDEFEKLFKEVVALSSRGTVEECEVKLHASNGLTRIKKISMIERKIDKQDFDLPVMSCAALTLLFPFFLTMTILVPLASASLVVCVLITTFILIGIVSILMLIAYDLGRNRGIREELLAENEEIKALTREILSIQIPSPQSLEPSAPSLPNCSDGLQ